MTEQKPAEPRGNHGLTPVIRGVKAKGMAAIDHRTKPYRDLMRWRGAVIADLGGEASLSAMQLGLIDTVCRTKFLIDACDSYLLGLPSIVNKRSHKLVALVEQRQDMVVVLTRQLTALGLQRREPAPQSLHDYLASPRTEPEPETDSENEPPETDANAEPE